MIAKASDLIVNKKNVNTKIYINCKSFFIILFCLNSFNTINFAGNKEKELLILI